MSAPATSFLAGLAPASVAGDAAQYVRAARPARFAATEEEPVGDTLPTVDALDPEDKVADLQPGGGAPAVRGDPQPAVQPAARARDPRGTARATAGDAVQSAALNAQTPLTVTRRAAAPGQGRARSTQSRSHRAPQTSEPTPAGDVITRPATLIIQRAPLREEVRAARAAAEPPHAAPVVHVTIDRIDVRAPAATPPAAAPPKARRAASQSLSEYLRQGNSSGGSGAK